MIRTGAAQHIDPANTDAVAALFNRVCGWGIPAAKVAMVLDGVNDTTMLTHTKEWFEGARRGDGKPILVLAGPTGVGKTVAAAWAMFHADPILPYGGKWRTEQAPRFRHASTLTEITGYSDECKAERVALKNTKCLVIDDIGAEIATEHFLSMFDALFDARYGGYGYTILTTNLTNELFSARYGPRVYDRIRERGEWYDVTEPSMRGAP